MSQSLVFLPLPGVFLLTVASSEWVITRGLALSTPLFDPPAWLLSDCPLASCSIWVFDGLLFFATFGLLDGWGDGLHLRVTLGDRRLPPSFIPGSYQAVYNGSKAFLNSFSFALRNELQDTGVTVTCLMPGPTETRFFERAGMLDTDVGQAEKDDPADVAKVGFDAMMDGEGDVVAGWKNKFQAAMANVTPASVLAAQHAKMAAPATAKN